MRVGLSYDLKTAFTGHYEVDDALEEYDSLETIRLISDALEAQGHSVVHLGGGNMFLANVQNQNVDIVFNIAEGQGSYRSREAQVPAVLEMLGIPYTGSDPQCLSVCLDKPLTKKLLAVEGIATPDWLVCSDIRELDSEKLGVFSFPAIIKPAWEGSSKGIRTTSLVHNAAQAKYEITRIIEQYRQPAMLEEYIDGDEVTVGIIGNNPPQILGMMRVLPKNKPDHFIYSLEVKRDYLNLVEYECPLRLSANVTNRLESASLKVFRTLGCRDFSRVDFRVDRNGVPYFIEINPLPGLGSYSDLIIMAKMMGWQQEKVICSILNTALERYPQCISV